MGLGVSCRLEKNLAEGTPVAKMKDLTERTMAERWRSVKTEEELWLEVSGDLEETVAAVAKRLLETALEDEMEVRLQASPYQRVEGRRGWRNGSYGRSLRTRWGLLELTVPRARQAVARSRVLERYRRVEQQLEGLVREAFLRGVSTRSVAAVVGDALGYSPSAQTVSRIVRGIDGEVRKFHRRNLADEWEYLLLDGVTMVIKHVGGVKKRVVLVAYGLKGDGTRELLDYRLAPSESATEWEAFLSCLHRRGFEGASLLLITTDGGAGLTSTLPIVYPTARHQRCWVHKLRNVANRLPRKLVKECLKGLHAVYLAENQRQADQAFREWAAQWRGSQPHAVECVERDLEQLTAFFACPPKDRQAVRTTNLIERAFREVRRRTRPMSCFQNSDSCERILYAILTNINKQWIRPASPTPSTQNA
jgi:putative transposase